MNLRAVLGRRGRALAPELPAACLVVAVTTTLAGSPLPPGNPDERNSVVRLRVYRADLLDAHAHVARLTATSILLRAGVPVIWADCTAGEPGCGPDDTDGTVLVRVIIRDQVPRSDACGESSRVPGMPGAYVSIDLACVHRLVQRLHFGLDHGDGAKRVTLGVVVGGMLAHELGHALGERHTRHGIMRESFTRTELRALIDEKLSFTDAQARRLRSEAVVLSGATAIANAR